ncbi:glutamate synthase subunit beta [Naumannella halotolerans]|uniref:Glutamate synthase (NADPH/NADH) small chain n=1 Tax=Naumannella halotolerans TaxID=993414 RepID=A0A4R7J7W1_9ACTN|nr:glutamate synthase subunit beta [Naumannella halotolerans]TDT33552.1 glutamate synthase (NADPH/NADH) small chain [Naumannella halotolerans]
MGDPRGFMKYDAEFAKRRPVEERLNDWNEVYPGSPGRALLPIITEQAGRCMDCGIPFCHTGCPLGNLIPEWNDLVWRGDWERALDRLHATNNFPEFTGRLCPAPCESACVVAISDDPVTIKNVEVSIIDKGYADDRVQPQVPDWHTGRTVAVVGSGPAGLAAAQQLTRAGHTVAVIERDDAPGGLMRYGIPEYKQETAVLERRLEQMRTEGTIFRCNTEVGVDVSWRDLKRRYDVVIIATGATVPREVPVAGRELKGIHQAMEYLPQGNRIARGEQVADLISAEGKHVVIVGGGDTGTDCLGTALRQKAASVTQLDIHPEPSPDRTEADPWPTYPRVLRVASANEEGGNRLYALNTAEFVDDGQGNVKALSLSEGRRVNGAWEEKPNTRREIPADLVLLAIGFSGPETDALTRQINTALDARGNVERNDHYRTSVPGVYCCGDAGRGQSLVVWAIAEGRACAAEVDKYLSGETKLPRPIGPHERPIGV